MLNGRCGCARLRPRCSLWSSRRCGEGASKSSSCLLLLHAILSSPVFNCSPTPVAHWPIFQRLEHQLGVLSVSRSHCFQLSRPSASRPLFASHRQEQFYHPSNKHIASISVTIWTTGRPGAHGQRYVHSYSPSAEPGADRSNLLA